MPADWIMTATGRQFWPLEPRVEDVCIEDIAHALAHLCRFGGHTREFYSVAQHSAIAAMLLGGACPRTALFGLLHDASEAYLVDVPAPVKHDPTFTFYREAEARLQRVIYSAFGLAGGDEPLEVKAIDRRLLRTEQLQLMPPPAPGEWRDDVRTLSIPVTPWTPHIARRIFLSQFHILTERLRLHEGCSRCCPE